VEGSHLRVVVFRDFHGEEAVGGSVVGDERGVAASYDDLK
jgi:hypothetical protein